MCQSGDAVGGQGEDLVAARVDEQVGEKLDPGCGRDRLLLVGDDPGKDHHLQDNNYHLQDIDRRD